LRQTDSSSRGGPDPLGAVAPKERKRKKGDKGSPMLRAHRRHRTKFIRPGEPPDLCTLGVTLGRNSNFVTES
jgi:hypothetical protein